MTGAAGRGGGGGEERLGRRHWNRLVEPGGERRGPRLPGKRGGVCGKTICAQGACGEGLRRAWGHRGGGRQDEGLRMLAGMGGGLSCGRRVLPALPQGTRCPSRARRDAPAAAAAGSGRSALESPLHPSAASAGAAPAALLVHLPPLPAREVTCGLCGAKCGLWSVQVVVRRERRSEEGFGMRVCGVGDWRATAADWAVVLFPLLEGVSTF